MSSQLRAGIIAPEMIRAPSQKCSSRESLIVPSQISPSPVGPNVAALRELDECVHRASTLKERSPFAVVLSRRQKGWAHDLPINNRTRVQLAARNFPACHDEIRNGGMAEKTRWSPDNCALRCPPLGSNRSQANRHQAGASWRGVRCFDRGSSARDIEDK